MLKLEKVSWSYDGTEESVPALRDIDLEIGRGELVVLAGVSGCGKTTLTRLINGLVPDCYRGTLEGKISVGGLDPVKEKTVGMSSFVGSVFQNPKSQFFNINSRSELAFPLENRGIPKDEILERLDETAKKLHMEGLVGRNMFHLSGGEKQKIAFASVAMGGQDILVLDEPSSNLDMEAVRDLRSILELWKGEGKTIVVSEHRFFFLKDLMDKLVILKNGTIDHVYGRDELLSLTPESFHEQGLRSLELAHSSGEKREKAESDGYLRIRNLEFTYKDSGHGMNIGSLDLSRGRVTALIGHNGAGKSTFLRCLAGLEGKATGSIALGNEEVKMKKMLSHTAMVMQDVNHQLFTESVEHELSYELKRRKVDKSERDAIVTKWLDRIGLADYRESHPMAISGGQKQRLAIAVAALADKDIILFDEPTSGLDWLHMLQVSSLIKELAASGKIIILVSHDPDLLVGTADDVVVMENGRIADSWAVSEETEGKLLEWFMDTLRG